MCTPFILFAFSNPADTMFFISCIVVAVATSYSSPLKSIAFFCLFEMVSLTFFGGVDEIGGNKVLLQDCSTRVFLDFGQSFTIGCDFFCGLAVS